MTAAGEFPPPPWSHWPRPDRRDVAQTEGHPPTPCPACSRAFGALADNDAQLRDLNERLYVVIADLTRERDALRERLTRFERTGT